LLEAPAPPPPLLAPGPLAPQALAVSMAAPMNTATDRERTRVNCMNPPREIGLAVCSDLCLSPETSVLDK
jgi:hypothetical protein